MKRVTITVFLISMLSGFALVGGSQRAEAEVALKAATHLELVSGDLQAAIDKYEEIVRSFPDERPIVAEALLKLGQSYEKLGSSEAKQAYERIVAEFKEQADQVRAARERLEQLQREAAISSSEPTIRRVWVDGENQFVPDFSSTPSPDGRYLPFVEWATKDIAVFETETGQIRFLTNDRPGRGGEWRGEPYTVVFSPTGTEVAYSFCFEGCEIRIASADSTSESASRTVFSRGEVAYLHLYGWHPDGNRILASLNYEPNETTHLGFVSLDSGEFAEIKSFGWGFPSARLSPDGKYVAYDSFPNRESETRDIYILVADGSQEETIIEHPSDDKLIDWAPAGDGLFFKSDRGGNYGIWASSIADGRRVDSPQLIKSDVGNIWPFAVTNNGNLYYLADHGGSDLYSVDVDPDTGNLTGEPVRLQSATEGKNFGVTWSPDGRNIAHIVGSTFAGDLIIRSYPGTLERELLSKPFQVVAGGLSWSPDSQRLLFTGRSTPAYPWSLYVVDVTTGVPEVVRSKRVDEVILYPSGWSADGESVLFKAVTSGGWVSLELDLESGEERHIFQHDPLSKVAKPSPDSKYLAMWNRTDESTVLKLIPTDGGPAKDVLTLDDPREGVRKITWAPDGRSIFFVWNVREGLQELWKVSAEGGQAVNTGLSFQRFRGFAFNPDGTKLIFSGRESQDEIWVMEGFLSKSQ